jgi:hypothetical protein
MQKKALRLGIAGFGLVALLALAGCNTHTDKIRDIKDNPSGYASKDVTIAGEVTDVSPQIPLLDLAAYQVNDDTGSIWVVSHAGAPIKGDKVGVKGRVDEAFKFGNSALGTVIEENERKVK